ncbi:MAG: hypothetical protein PHQ57_01990 [Candidatus Omnitrophica bacterium]|nr:hypothetical protein [Candidatus Omnitrophota bacterium]
MIEINLLPQELKAKSKTKKIAIVKDTKVLLYLIPVILAVFICVHFYLAVASIVKGSQIRALKNKWAGLEAKRKTLEDLKKEHMAVSSDASFLQQLTSQRIDWAQKLNRLSLDLPSGVWFMDLSTGRRDLVLKGAAVSLQKEEMTLINKFIDNLKKDPLFFKDFSALELTSYQRRVIGGYDIVDFVLTGIFKSR